MEITIERLYQGLPTTINGKEYLSTKDYVEPFINIMKKFGCSFVVNVQTPKQLTFSFGEQNITFNKVWVQAVMPEKVDKDGYAETYNLIYGLDVRTPVYKIFKAYKDKRTSNLYVFNAQWLNVYELQPGKTFNDLEPVVRNMMQQMDDSQLIFKKLKSSFIDEKQTFLGESIEKSMVFNFKHKGGTVKISPNMLVKAYEMVYMDSSSKYFIPNTEECSQFNYLEALSSLVVAEFKKDIYNVFEKSAIISEIFNTLKV